MAVTPELVLSLPAGLPAPGARRVSVRLTRDAERQVRAGHPWVFAASVTATSHHGATGDLAVLFDHRRRFLAIGLYDPGSPIRVRIVHHGPPRPIDRRFWAELIGQAVSRRRNLAADAGTTAYRCVHGENDGLPGLVVDRYDRTLVVKLDTSAWLPHLVPVVRAALDHAPGSERVVIRAGRRARSAVMAAGLAEPAVVAGELPEGPVGFLENGLRFEADVLRGQKTGHFLDQRHNRARVGTLADGARVLDVFSCTGGFGVHAAAGGARSVHGIDASPHAVAAAARNFDLNRHLPVVARCRATAETADAFAAMSHLATQGRHFDLVVIDPPSFASKQADVDRALSAYGRLTRLALDLLASGGLLVQSSCSSRVPADAFFTAIQASSIRAGRRLDEIERTGHGVDHPIGFPQGAYLKTLFARVR